jgi:hypothetical protein
MTEPEVLVLPLEAESVESLKTPKRSNVQAYKKYVTVKHSIHDTITPV